MDEKLPKSILQTIVDENISSGKLDLWPVVKDTLIARNHPLFSTGDRMDSQRSNRTSLRWTVVVMCAALLVIFFFTPPGKVLAQDILKFFFRGSTNSLAAPTLSAPVISQPDLPELNPDRILPTAIPQNSLPFQQACGNLISPYCNFSQIQPMVDFQLYQLSVLPEHVQLVGVTGGPQQVTSVYAGDGINGVLRLQQEPVLSGSKRQVIVAASAEVEGAQIGNKPAEYVDGGWFGVDSNDGQLGWHDDAGIQTLRWQTEDQVFTLQFLAAKMSTGILLDKTALIDLAKKLVVAGKDEATNVPVVDLSIDQLSKKVGFDVRQPTWLPDGYTYQDATVVSDRNGVCLYYRYQDGLDGAPLLAIYEGPVSTAPSPAELKMVLTYEGKVIDTPQDQQTVSVAGASDNSGLLIDNGGVDAGKICSYPGYLANRGLFWQSDGLSFAIFGLLDQFQGRGFVTRMEMQQIAESLNGEESSTIASLDPDRLNRVSDTEKWVGFDVKTPGKMTDDLYFDHALVRQTPDLEEVYMIYIGGPNGDGRRYGLTIIQAAGVTQTLEETYLAGGYERLKIKGQPGIYREFCWTIPVSDKTECNQESTWFEDGIRYDLSVYLPGLMSKEDFLVIAESLH